MKKTLTLFALASLLSVQAFATYFVILKDGTRYKAKAKPTVTNGKALVLLESGQSLQFDATLIDFAKSEQASKLGLGDASVINVGAPPPPPPKAAAPSLGSTIKLRKLPAQEAPSPSDTAPAVRAPVATGPALSNEVVEKFERAFENVGIFEHKVTSTGPHTIHADVTADSEEKVFNAISATAFLMMRNAGVQGAQVDLVELFMGTVTGGSSGRFRMTREDAQAIESKTISREEYFVRKVLF